MITFDTPFKRLIGLMGKTHIHEKKLYMLTPCSSIHTMFMKIPIDVVFLDKDNRVLALYPNVKKNKLLSVKKAKYVLEGKVGLIDFYSIKLNEQVCVK
jgi:uncharacterized membrane protein (UPF0127 family)